MSGLCGFIGGPGRAIYWYDDLPYPPTMACTSPPHLPRTTHFIRTAGRGVFDAQAPAGVGADAGGGGPRTATYVSFASIYVYRVRYVIHNALIEP